MNGHAQLGLTGVPGFTYELQRSSDLDHWVTLHTVTMPVEALVTFDDAAPLPSAAYYRVVAL